VKYALSFSNNALITDMIKTVLKLYKRNIQRNVIKARSVYALCHRALFSVNHAELFQPALYYTFKAD